MINDVRSIQTCPPRPSMRQVVIGLIGGILGIGATAWLTQLTNVPLLIAPFGATCVLLFAAPTAPLAQPRNIVGGHFISALVGIVIFQLLGNSPLSMAIAVGLAIASMQLCRAVHPPAGANPLVIIMAGVNDYFFLITPVLAGSLILILTALILNNLDKSKRWPLYWY